MQPQLTQGRDSLTPYLYPQAIEYYNQQKSARWEADEISYTKDVTQWPTIDPVIKDIVGGVLRGFVQTEVVVSDYWSNIPKWFPHPDIALMARRFSDMEGTHALSYNQLSANLGLDTYKAFKADPNASSKIAFLQKVENQTLPEIALSLAVFSAFTEGVILFSSFAILQWLKTQHLLPGVTTVIEYSVRDERLHADAGSWLFAQLLFESPVLDTPELWSSIYLAAQTSIKLEESFIDSVFAGRSLDGLDPSDLKQFIRGRADARLQVLGSKDRIAYDSVKSDRIATWFDLYNTISPITDSFAKRPTTYSVGLFKPKGAFAFS